MGGEEDGERLFVRWNSAAVTGDYLGWSAEGLKGHRLVEGDSTADMDKGRASLAVAVAFVNIRRVNPTGVVRGARG